MDKKAWVYDIETLKKCFTYSAINIYTEQIVTFVLHEDRFELEEFIVHLTDVKGQIGFNNLSFDYPIIHYIIKNYKNWIWDLNAGDISRSDIITYIYNEAQRIIKSQDNKDNKFVYTSIKESEVLIKQLDLFKIWHYDNRARSTGLKALEISMNYPNVMDMPISHDEENISVDQIDEILEYNINDILATYEFYKKTVDLGKIDLRKKILKKYNLPCLNWNNGKIGENLILKLYCDKLNLNIWDIKKLRSPIDRIYLKECIPSSIEFKTTIFKKVYDSFKNKIVDQSNFEDKDSKGKNRVTSIIYKGCKIDYGLGGVHGVTSSGIYESNDQFIIKTADVASLYPNLPIAYNFYIRHLGPEFLEVYKDNIVDVRLAEKEKPKDQQDKTIIDGFKEAANIPYGKSNFKESFLYDPIFTMKTTVSGQLSVSMLAEELGENIPNLELIMFNTDGFEVKIPRKYEELYYHICNEWMTKTNLVLEFDNYQKMWIRDVNNYGCITTKGKIKNKGAFEVDKVIGGEPAYHKDNSFRVVRIAIQEHFINNIPIEETILNHNNIYDFCGRQKFSRNGDSYGEVHYIRDSTHIIEKQQHNVRYYIAKSDKTFIKVYSKGSTEVINKGYRVEIFNKYEEKDIKDYKIDYNFYIDEAYKIINTIDSKQLTLW